MSTLTTILVSASLQDYLHEELESNNPEVKQIIANNSAQYNFLLLQIYYEDLNFDQITETQGYTVRYGLRMRVRSVHAYTCAQDTEWPAHGRAG